MSFSKKISSLADTLWFYCRRMVLRCRAERYRRLAISDEVRIGKELTVKHERRDPAFEKKVEDFNRKYRKRAPEGAVPVSLNLHPNRIADNGSSRNPSPALFVFFSFKDTLTIQKGTRKLTVDRSKGLDVSGNLKAELLESEVNDFYRQTVLSVELPRSAVEVKPDETETPEVKPERIVLDPEAVARERERFISNAGKVEKAINSGTGEADVVLEPFERELVQLLRSCPGCKASRMDLQAVLTPYRKRVALVVNSVNSKCYDLLREPLIRQVEDDYVMEVSYYNSIFGNGE